MKDLLTIFVFFKTLFQYTIFQVFAPGISNDSEKVKVAPKIPKLLNDLENDLGAALRGSTKSKSEDNVSGQ